MLSAQEISFEIDMNKMFFGKYNVRKKWIIYFHSYAKMSACLRMSDRLSLVLHCAGSDVQLV